MTAVPPLQRASQGPSALLDESASHPTPGELGDQLPPALVRAYDDLCRLATQASTDDIIDSATYVLDQLSGANGGGYKYLASSQLVGTIAVLNLGTRMMAVVASQPQGGPPPQGQGQTLVAPGQLVTLPLGGSYHTIYGAFGDSATVVRFASVRDPHVGDGQGGVFTPNVPNPSGGGALFYTAPFPGVIPAYLTDYQAGNPGATVARVKFFDGNATTGLEILDVTIPIGGTVGQQFDKRPRLLASGLLTVQQVSGDAGDPKVLVGVQ